MDIRDSTFNSLPEELRAKTLGAASGGAKFILPIIDIRATSSRKNHEPHNALESNDKTWIAEEMKLGGEELELILKDYYIPTDIYVQFKDEDKRVIDYSVISGDHLVLYEGNQTGMTPLIPARTNSLSIKCKSYTIADHTYPNPGIKNVVICGLVDKKVAKALKLRPVKEKKPKRVSAEAAIGYSSIYDQEILSLSDSNDVDLEHNRIWVGKGVGSYFSHEYPDYIKCSELHFKLFQHPPRSYLILVTVYPQHGLTMATLNSTPTIFQRFINIQKGMDKEIIVPLTGVENHKSEKTILISLYSTDSYNKLLSVVDFFVT